MRLAIALTLYNGEIQNTPIIHNATLYCIFLSFLRELERGVLWQLLDTKSNSSTSGKSHRRISSRNTSCIFTKELNREPQQYSTNYLYKVLLVHATTSLYLP